MRTLISDLRLSARSLVRTPGFTLIAVLTLALGIGANVTIFSVAKAVLFQRLPFLDPDRMVIVEESNLRQPDSTRNPTLSTALEWRAQARSFAGIEAGVEYVETANLAGTGAAECVRIQYVSPGLLPLLGLKPALGRNLTADDGSANTSSAVLIGDGLWKRRFGASPSVLGRTVRLGGRPVMIAGVLPSGAWLFPGAANADIWAPLDPVKGNLTPDTRYLTIIGRLKQGVSLEQAQAEMKVLGQRLEQASPETNKGWGARVERLREYFFGGWREDMFLLAGAVGFVLLIACANVASLLVARGVARRREIAIRASLGASRRRIARQLLSESLTVALAGGLLATAFAAAGIHIFVALAPEWFPNSAGMRIDAGTLAFGLALSLVTACLFGLAPAWQVSKTDPGSALKVSAASGGDRGINFGRNALVVAEIALTMVLLIGAGLTMNSFLRLRSVDPGFDLHNLLSADLELLDSKHMEVLPQDKKRVTPLVDTFYAGVLERVQALPGVQSAAMCGMGRMCPFRVLGGPLAGASENRAAIFEAVSPDYFHTIGQRLVRGRVFTGRDDEHAPWVAVVNEAMARSYFEGRSPIGKVIHVAFRALSERQFPEDRPREIVGVVADIRQFGPREDADPTMYVPNRQHNFEYPGGAGRTHLTRNLLVRTKEPPLRFAEALRRIVAEVDRDQTVSDVEPMELLYGGSLAFWRFYLRLFGIFSGIAVILAAVGTYGLVSYSVSRRTHEFGIRLALGASRGAVARMVLKQGLVLAALGIVLGAAGALALTRLIANMLWKVKPTDPLTYAAVALLLLAVSLGACLVPARRSTRVDPMVALRYE
jgi:putative ABC transport system permease protein